MTLAHQSDVMKMNACQRFHGAGDHEMKSVVLHGHTHPEATSPPPEVHHNRDKNVCTRADSSQMNGCCCSVWNWNGASQTSQFLLDPDGRLWKPRADHSQSPCRLETAACRLRRKEAGRRPTMQKKSIERRQKEKQKNTLTSMQNTHYFHTLHVNQILQNCLV